MLLGGGGRTEEKDGDRDRKKGSWFSRPEAVQAGPGPGPWGQGPVSMEGVQGSGENTQKGLLHARPFGAGAALTWEAESQTPEWEAELAGTGIRILILRCFQRKKKWGVFWGTPASQAGKPRGALEQVSQPGHCVLCGALAGSLASTHRCPLTSHQHPPHTHIKL